MAIAKMLRTPGTEWVAERVRRRHKRIKVSYTGDRTNGTYVVIEGEILEFRRSDLLKIQGLRPDVPVTELWDVLVVARSGEIVQQDSVKFIVADPGMVTKKVEVRSTVTITVYPSVDLLESMDFWADQLAARPSRTEMFEIAAERFTAALRQKFPAVAANDPARKRNRVPRPERPALDASIAANEP